MKSKLRLIFFNCILILISSSMIQYMYGFPFLLNNIDKTEKCPCHEKPNIPNTPKPSVCEIERESKCGTKPEKITDISIKSENITFDEKKCIHTCKKPVRPIKF